MLLCIYSLEVQLILTKPVFLHVGCGSKHQPQTPFAEKPWHELRLDINPLAQPDIVGTMTDMSSVPDASVDCVYSSHNIEHLYPHEVPLALQEFRRVLKPDGFVLITCPDLQSVCALVAENKLLDPAYQSRMGPITPLDILYGHRASMQNGNLYMSHRCGFTAKSLAFTLNSEGFASAVQARPQNFDLWAIGAVAHAEESLLELAAKYFPG